MSETPVAAKPPLDEVMLAMDVVDTLRHRERIVERALAADEQDRQLVTRLKEIYAGQGIEVSDAIIERGVRDLREDRFSYVPTPPSFGRMLAGVYVSRGRWGKPVGALIAVVAVGLVAYQTLVRAPRLDAITALPDELAQAYTAVVELADSPAVDADAAALRALGETALARSDYAGVRGAIADLDSLHDALAVTYEIRVVSGGDETAGVWRVPDANPSAQNFYLIVEAIGGDGRSLPMSITNEETGRTSTVRRWGQRVDASTFEAVRADKLDDGIIQRAAIGAKRPGALEPEYRAGVLDGAITDW